MNAIDHPDVARRTLNAIGDNKIRLELRKRTDCGMTELRSMRAGATRLCSYCSDALRQIIGLRTDHCHIMVLHQEPGRLPDDSLDAARPGECG